MSNSNTGRTWQVVAAELCIETNPAEVLRLSEELDALLKYESLKKFSLAASGSKKSEAASNRLL